MIRPRTKPRRGEPTKAEKQAAREKVYRRAAGCCQLRLAPDCIHGVLPLDGPDELSHGHLVHFKSKRRFGWMESDIQQHFWGCWRCHKWMHNGGKPCAKKPISEDA